MSDCDFELVHDICDIIEERMQYTGDGSMVDYFASYLSDIMIELSDRDFHKISSARSDDLDTDTIKECMRNVFDGMEITDEQAENIIHYIDLSLEMR